MQCFECFAMANTAEICSSERTKHFKTFQNTTELSSIRFFFFARHMALLEASAVLLGDPLPKGDKDDVVGQGDKEPPVPASTAQEQRKAFIYSCTAVELELTDDSGEGSANDTRMEKEKQANCAVGMSYLE
jgi:hypothetical protein